MLHGPEIIDSGSALRLIGLLQRHGQFRAVLGGTMGRVAFIDAGLQDLVEISPRSRPSQSVRDLDRASDFIFLLNQAKSRESGLIFGTMVAAAAGKGKPLLQIDCGGRFVSILRGREDEEAKEMAAGLASELGFDILDPPSQKGVSVEGGRVRRILSGVRPGELISVNGTVIGRAVQGRVEIVAEGGKIVDLPGAAPKKHGLEKLGSIDLAGAIIRSGSIRRTEARPVQALFAESAGDEEEAKVAVFIDHCAEDAFEMAEGAGMAVVVGDDTTAIAGDILLRLGLRVVGIVDGDIDRLGGGTAMMPGSIIFRVRPGQDDVVGGQVRTQIFKGGRSIKIGPGDLARMVKAIAGNNLMAVEEISGSRAD